MDTFSFLDSDLVKMLLIELFCVDPIQRLAFDQADPILVESISIEIILM